MPIFRIAGKLILFIHIPKTAGTSMETMLSLHPQCRGIHCLEVGMENVFNAVAHCSPQHFHAQVLESIFDLRRFDFIFTIVRDPLCRLLSEHTMRIERGDIDRMTFENWYLIAREKRLKDPYLYDNHLRPAYEYLTEQCHVFELVDGLSHIWQNVCQFIGIDAAGSRIQHIKPCGGQNEPLGTLSSNIIHLIAEDYQCDYTLRRRIFAKRSPERPWVIGSDLL